MKALVLLACALSCADSVALPECRGGACTSRDASREADGGWPSRDYLVNGKRMSVASHAETIRWMCWGGDPTDPSAPHFLRYIPVSANTVELIDCNVPSTSYQKLFTELTLSPITLSWANVKDLTIINRPMNVPWPSLEELQYFNDTYRNEKGEWIAAAAANLPRNSLQHLSLRGTPMSTEQLISIYGIWTLTLKDTGLTRVTNLSEFTSLHRLVLDEPLLEDAQLLGTAPALDELVLHAPDAGLAPMPNLRDATFLNIYAMGSIFGHCKNLKKLTIKGGQLDRIHERWLAGCTSLTNLKLTLLPNLRNLPEDFLSETTGLQVLNLSHNRLESLPEGLFSNAKFLTSLNLRDNSLIALPSDFLSAPKFLKYLCLSNNSGSLAEQLRSMSVKSRSFYYTCDIE